MKRSRMPATAAALVLSALSATSSPLGAQAGKEASADASSMLNHWAAQTDLRSMRLAWNHMQGVVGYTVSCEIGTKALKTFGTMSADPAAPKDANGMPRRRSSIIPINEPGAEHRCFLQWRTDPKGPISTRLPFNVVTPVATFDQAPTPPGSVTARATGPGEITVTWDGVPGATAYSIGRSVSPDGFRSFCDLCPSTTLIIDKVAKTGSKHVYSITPVTPRGVLRGGVSNIVVAVGTASEVINTADPAVNPDVKRPGGVTATVSSATTVLISWDAVENAEGYDVYREANGSGFVKIAHVRNGPPRTQMELPDYLGGILANSPAVSARYAVRSTDFNGWATEPAISNDVRIEAKAPVSGTIVSTNASNAKAVATSATSVTLTWSPPAGSLSCVLSRSLDGGAFTAMPPIAVGAASYVDTAPTLLAQRPRYRITCGTAKSQLPAVSFTGPEWDQPSAPSTVGSTGTVPTNLRAVQTSADSVTLTWGPPTTAVACMVQRSLDGAAYVSLGALPVGTFQYVDTSVGLASRRPRYQLLCGDPNSKSAAAPVRFPDPRPGS